MGTVALGIRHVLCTPLRLVRYVERADDKPGEQAHRRALSGQPRTRRPVSSSAFSALEMLSAEAALAIENARLYREALDKAKYEQELKVAATIQRALLPGRMCKGAFFTSHRIVVAVSRRRRRLLRLRRSAGGRFGFIVGDVAGKGSPAALLAVGGHRHVRRRVDVPDEPGRRYQPAQSRACSAGRSKTGF